MTTRVSIFLFGILLLVSCASNPYKNIIVLEQQQTLQPAFKDLSKGKLYKAKVEVLKHYLSGLIVFKLIKESNRVVFTSETGVKFFDFEFAPDTFIVHHVMEQFDNKHVLNTLREDLGTVLFYKSLNVSADKVKLKDDEALRTKDGEDWLYYYYSNSLSKIERTGENKQKVIYSFENYVEDIPQLINIAHQDFKLNIELNYIKR